MIIKTWILAGAMVTASVGMLFAEDNTGTASSSTTVTVAGKTQTTCPVMGEPINKKIFADYQGKRVYFCCKMCVKRFQKDPEQYLKKLTDAGVAPDNTPVEQK